MIRIVLFVLGFLLVVLLLVPAGFEDRQNVVLRDSTWPVSEQARKLHESLRIADLHADTLLWNRDLLERAGRGHVDLPRLQQGGVVLQVMAAVTKVPEGQNYISNPSDAGDRITRLAVAQLWPPRTWGSILERALYQADRLNSAARRSDDLVVIRTKAELTEFLQNRPATQVATLLAAEGAHPLEGELDNLERLWDAGYRVLGLQHFFDNDLGGSLHGESRDGLTLFGRKVVRKAIDMGFVIDVAHSSPATVDHVLAMNHDPVIVSHTGIKGTCDSPRNLADGQMKRIAAAGGLIGIGYWDAVCDITPSGIARTIAYAIDLVGVDHVALGSDYDGTTTVTFDTGELVVLTQALIDADLSDEDIRKVMGENQLEFFLEQLP